MKYIPLIFLMLSIGINLNGQLSGNNLLEFQLGNLPNTEPARLSTHYDQLNLAYRNNGLRASLRYEQFLSQNDGSSYNRISQYQLQYRKGGLDLKVGNFSEILGNGLLLRAYEIPSSVFEEEAYRVRYGFYRDIRGVSVNYTGRIGYIKALRGKSLSNTLPPVLDEDLRRSDLVEGLESGLTFYGQSAGFVLLRNSIGQQQDAFYSLLLKGGFLSFFSYNFEYAHSLEAGKAFFARADDARYGLYASMSFSYGSFGLSAEYKDYNDMLIGSGISDPPTLVKEHKYKLLNRSIHVPQYYSEQGLQLEAYYSFRGGSRLLLNYAKAVNFILTEYIFTEYFAEYSFSPGRAQTMTVFADYSQDPLKYEGHRYTGGFISETQIGRKHSLLLELEYQRIERDIIQAELIDNIVLIGGYSHSPNTSLSLTFELSNDPQLTSNGGFRSWIGVDISQKLNARHTLSLFAGQRRGGPACTSGICYEVLDFEGLELRFKSKF